MTQSPADVLLVTPWLAENSLGRTHCLWRLCEAAGLRAAVVSLTKGAELWEPLRGSEFAASCRALPVSSRAAARVFARMVDQARVIIVVKAIPESLGLAAPFLAGRTNVLLDVDDPDAEAQTRWLPRRERVVAALHPRYWQLCSARRVASRFETTVSNPLLVPLYGGTVVPHVRDDRGSGDPHVSGAPRVAFVGTVKRHKGIDDLREAVQRLADRGFSLVITSAPPADAKPHESWVGITSLDDGLALTATADIVAVPSLAGGYAEAQFPVKIIDAMLAARPIVASSVGPIPWAIGSGGLTYVPGDIGGLCRCLLALAEPDTRQRIGAAGRTRALQHFTTEAVLPTFRAILTSVV